MKATSIIKQVWRHPSNEGHRLSSLGRAIAWQLYKRTNNSPLAVKHLEGFELLCFTDSFCASNTFYFNQYSETAEMELVRRILRPGDGFVDGGANIGVYSLLTASLVGPSGRVLAFEPFEATAKKFLANVAFNSFDQITLRQAALCDTVGEKSFVTNRDVSNRIQTPIDDDSITVKVESTTLDAELQDGFRYTIGKLDLEGAEVAAIAGAAEVLKAANPPIWIIEWLPHVFRRGGIDPRELLDPLHANGFVLVKLEGDSLVPTEPPSGGNIIAVHRDSIPFFEERLRERPSAPPAQWSMPRKVPLKSINL